MLKDFAPGSQLPILLYDGDVKTDTLQIEEFLEETLGPPEYLIGHPGGTPGRVPRKGALRDNICEGLTGVPKPFTSTASQA